MADVDAIKKELERRIRQNDQCWCKITMKKDGITYYIVCYGHVPYRNLERDRFAVRDDFGTELRFNGLDEVARFFSEY